MKDYSNYRPSPSENLLWSSKKIFERKLEDFGEDVKVDNISIKAIVMTHSNPYNELKEDRKFLCENAVKIDKGSIVDYNNKKWLVVGEVKSNKTNKYTKIFQCNNTINIFKNNVLYQIPLVIESGVRLFQLGSDATKYIETPSSTIVARVPNNEITRLISRGETYKIGLQNYEIKDINDVIEKGLLILKLEYSQESQPEYTYTINILNGLNLDIQKNSTLQLNTQVLINNNLISPTPPLLFSSSNEEVASVDNSGLVTTYDVIDSCEIAVKLVSDESVQQIININVIPDVVDNFTYLLNGDSEIIRGNTKTYIAQKFNNGEFVSGDFEFSIIPGSTPDNAYSLVVVSGNECKIAANSSIYDIVLRAIDVDNGEFVDKNIRLRNLF